mgnify:FL=1|jgi:uncharacterized protein (DUF302 family)
MGYYFSTKLNDTSHGEAIERVSAALALEGFGIISTIDVSATFKMKLDVDFKKYTILGACNPGFAHRALQSEDKVGVFLPCNVLIIEQESGEIEVAAVDPVASMLAIENAPLKEMIQEVKTKLQRVISTL